LTGSAQPRSALDHLVVAATTLADGIEYFAEITGVVPHAGGKHVAMGTHNALVRLSAHTYLEIIAIDPAGTTPARPRWFGLDETDLATGPRLVHVVARSKQIGTHRHALMALGLVPGDPVAASRPTPGGVLSWQILVRDDGRLECGGALPTLIEWNGRHPTEAMPESGVTLKSLALAGVPDGARDALRLAHVAVSSTPGTPITAVLATPKGDVTLESR